MDCKITKMSGIRLIGFGKTFSIENAYTKIPEYWGEIFGKYAAGTQTGDTAASAYKKAIDDNRVGEYAVCIDDEGADEFKYLIAGEYAGGEVPEGMELYEFPENDWAVFDCFGPIPETLQTLNTMIFKEWLPDNPEYELCGNATVEWYGSGDTKSADYHSAIWIPVKRK